MMPGEGGPEGGREGAAEALLESIRVAAHAAVDAGDGAAAVELMRLMASRRTAAGWATVESLDDARRRRSRSRIAK